MASGTGDLIGIGIFVIVLAGGWWFVQSGALNQPQTLTPSPSLSLPSLTPTRRVNTSVGSSGGGRSSGGGGGSSGSGCNSGSDCSCTAYVDKGNSPGWYTAGANSSGGAGWGGKPGHHHCDWRSKCCFCTDIPKCIRTGTPPQKPGSCRPDWGTSGYLGGGKYPKNADFSKCPPGTGPPGNNT